jgi:hypothetical protein
MIEISVHTDIKEATRWLSDIQRKQIPFATAKALTDTAKLVQAELKREMLAEFDNPSPYTKNSTFSTSATKATLQAVVGIKDKGMRVPPAKLLKEHFTGGMRGGKPMERAMMALGALPSGWRVVPGQGLKLDSYGNPNRNQVREILGSLKNKTSIYKGRGKKVALVGYFLVPIGSDTSLTPGIYLRQGRAIKPMFIFVKQAGYRKVLDLPRIAGKVVAQSFNARFSAALESALATAR